MIIGLDTLAKLAETNDPTLTFMDIEEEFTNDAVENLAAAITKNPQVKKLSLTLKLNRESLRVFSSFLVNNNTLRTLDLRMVTGFSEEALITFSKALQNNTTLKEIYFTGSHMKNRAITITKDHIGQILLPLRKRTTPFEFSLVNMNFWHENGIGAIKNDSLIENLCAIKMTGLTLMQNQIDDNLAISIFTQLATCQTLRSLDVRLNNIGEAGIEALAKLVQKIPSLVELEYDSEKISSELNARIASLLERNKSNVAAAPAGTSLGASHSEPSKKKQRLAEGYNPFALLDTQPVKPVASPLPINANYTQPVPAKAYNPNTDPFSIKNLANPTSNAAPTCLTSPKENPFDIKNIIHPPKEKENSLFPGGK